MRELGETAGPSGWPAPPLTSSLSAGRTAPGSPLISSWRDVSTAPCRTEKKCEGPHSIDLSTSDRETRAPTTRSGLAPEAKRLAVFLANRKGGASFQIS